jgi:hypothetical protein
VAPGPNLSLNPDAPRRRCAPSFVAPVSYAKAMLDEVLLAGGQTRIRIQPVVMVRRNF